MKRAFRKDVSRGITHSISRFLAIFFIVALGVGFFAGLKATTPDMKDTADKYLDDTHFMDIRVASTMGLTEDDVSVIRAVQGVQDVMPTYTTDALFSVNGDDAVVRLHGMPDDTSGSAYLNQSVIKEGRLPQRSDECVIVQQKMFKIPIKLGDRMTLSNANKNMDDTLKQKSFTIVGFADSPLYMSYSKEGSSVGSGVIDYAVFVPKSAFSMDVYTDIYLTVQGAGGLNTYQDDYKNTVDAVKKKLEDLAPERTALRFEDVKSEAQKKVDDAQAEYDAQKADAERQLSDAKAKLDAGRAEIETNKKKLADGKAQYNAGVSELMANKKKFNDQYQSGIAAINDAKAKLAASLPQLQKAESDLKAAKDGIDTLQANINALTAAGQTAQVAALQAQLTAAQQQYDSGMAEYTAQKQQYDAGVAQLPSQEASLAAGKSQAEASFAVAQAKLDSSKKDLDKGESDLADAEKKLVDGEAEYNKNKQEADDKLASAKQQIDDARGKIADIKQPEWYVLNRETNMGYVSLKSDADRVNAISSVFPVFFFLVAALVCLTTMTRMVEEERTQIGTLKALGYSKRAIASKYIIYAALASIGGSIAGLAVGFQLFPTVIFNAYRILYSMPPVRISFNMEYAVVTSAAAVLCTVLAAWFACYGALAENPARLMLPRAPKAGKRILLERIKIIWSHMSFTQKVTARNLFRYKKRFYMTVIGIAGCTALLLTGFGLKDSISDIVGIQYSQIIKYNMTGQFADGTFPLQDGKVKDILSDKSRVTDYLGLYEKTTDAYSGDTQISTYLVVPQDRDRLADFINLRGRLTHQSVTLGDDGAVITEKMSNKLGVHVGDSVTVKDDSGAYVKIPVSGITENYVYNYVYMSPNLYQKVFGKTLEYKTFVGKIADTSKTAQDSLSKDLLSNDTVSSVAFTTEISKTFNDAIKSLNVVVLVLIVCAGLLAFIVLYNLTNINITERQREVATIKVLGFFDREVSSYIYRETAVLSIIGTAVGLVLGIFLHAFVITTTEIDMVMFGRIVKPLSYVFSAALTIVFSILVNFVMHRKLKKVDMVESLKSVD